MRGEADAGIVYRTDALEAGPKVRVVATADPSLHDPIEYPAALVRASSKQEAARHFLEYLMTEPAQTVLSAKGFARPAPATQPTKQ